LGVKFGLEDLDTNKDGAISTEEAQAQAELAKDFKALDQNQDGKLDAAEFAQFETAQALEQQAMPDAPAPMAK